MPLPATEMRRRLAARVRARLRPLAGRLPESPPATNRRVRKARERVSEGRAERERQRAELKRLESELREVSREQGALRGEFLEAVRAFTPYVVAEADGVDYMIPTDDSFSRQLFVKQERREMRLLARVQNALEELGADRGRRTLLDVGGNIGTGPVEAVCRLGFERAIAFEPHPGNFKVCRVNVILNDAEDRVELVQAAVSDGEGTAVLQVSSRNSGAHSLSGADVGALGTIEVPTVTFDGMAARGEFDPDAVSLLWMDIEGYEIHALQGGRCLLERSVPFVMELNAPVLRSAGRADQLLPTLSGHYTHVVNLRDAGKQLTRQAVQPLADVAAMLDDAEEKAMDVLLCRLP